MKGEIYLTIEAHKQRGYPNFPRALGKVSVTKRKPSTRPEEIALKIALDIPDSLFEKPTLEATVTVPKSGDRTAVVSADVMSNIEQIIKEQTGFSVTVSAVAEDDGRG